MWPWSYSKCERALQKSQIISGCDVTEHFELHPQQGRGATEIDVVEVMPGVGPLPVVPKDVKLPYNSMTLQVHSKCVSIILHSIFESMKLDILS
jgi:hypothetical protein